jgi:hypothetical protein
VLRTQRVSVFASDCGSAKERHVETRPLLDRLARSQSGTLVTDITVGYVGKVLCVVFDKNFVSCREDYVWVSHRARTAFFVDGYLAAGPWC